MVSSLAGEPQRPAPSCNWSCTAFFQAVEEHEAHKERAPRVESTGREYPDGESVATSKSTRQKYPALARFLVLLSPDFRLRGFNGAVSAR
jgi:hypothetical protein